MSSTGLHNAVTTRPGVALTKPTYSELCSVTDVCQSSHTIMKVKELFLAFYGSNLGDYANKPNITVTNISPPHMPCGGACTSG